MNNVDERVVQMTFDNKQFERGVKETMSTLDKFKEGLNFGKVKDGLDSLKDAFAKVDFLSIADGINQLVYRFSAVGEAINSLEHRIINFGVSTAKSLSVDQISAGWQKYEGIMNATRTIMNATHKSADEVGEIMERLNKYTDETSYNFSQMAGYISNFTTAGIDLEVAEKSMEGIANAAAHAGIGINEAAYPMQTLTKAMSEGKLSRIRWESLQLSKFITPELIQEFIKAGKELGKLDEKGATKGKGKKSQVVTSTNILDTLSTGWLDNDVMNYVFGEVYGTREGLGERAFKAAQEAKTFTDVIDTLKDVVSTGWMQSFQYIFGNVDEASKLFTRMANEFAEAIAVVSEIRNELLSGWKEGGGRDSLVQALHNVWVSIKRIGDLVGDALGNVFKTISADDIINVTKSLEQFTRSVYAWLMGNAAKEGDKIAPRFVLIRMAVEGFLSIIKLAAHVIGTAGKAFVNFFTGIVNFDDILMFIGVLGRDIKKFVDNLIGSGKIEGFFKKLTIVIKPLVKSIWNVITALFDFGKSLLGMAKGSDAWKSVKDWFNDFTKTIDKDFPRLVSKITRFMNNVAKVLRSPEALQKISEAFAKFWGMLTGLFSKKKTKDASNKIKEAKKPVDLLKEIGDILKKVPIGPMVAAAGGILVVGLIVKKISGIMKSVSEFTENLKGGFGLKDLIENFTESLKDKKKASDAEQNIKNLLKIAASVLMFATSIKFIGDLGWEKLIIGILGLGSVVGVIFVFLGQLKKMEKNDVDPTKIVKSLRSVAVSVAIMSSALVNIGKLDFQHLIPAVIGLGAIVGLLMLTMKMINSSEEENDAPDGLIRMAVSTTIISSALVMLSQLSLKQIGKGLLGLGGIIAALIIFYKILNSTESMDAPKKMLILSASVVILTMALERLGKLKLTEILSGILGLVGIIGAMILFYSVINLIGGLGAPKKMLSLAASVLIMTVALTKMASLKLNQIKNGLIGLAGIVATMVAFYAIINLIGGTRAIKNLLKFSVSVWIISNVLKSLADLSIDQIKTGLIGMAGIIGELAAFLVSLRIVGGATAPAKMIGLAISIMLLTNTLIKISNLSWKQIIKGLAGLGLIFTELSLFMLVVKSGGLKAGILQAAFGVLGMAIGMIVDGVSKLGKLSWSEILRGVVGLGAVLVALGVFMAIIPNMFKGDAFKRENYKNLVQVCFSMIGIAAAVWLVAMAMKPLSELSWEGLAKGLTGVVALLGGMALFMYGMSKIKGEIKGSVAILLSLLGVVILIAAFVAAVKLLESVDTSKIIAIAGSIAVLTIVAGALGALLGKVGIGAVLQGAIGIILVLAALGAGVAVFVALIGASVDEFVQIMGTLSAGLITFQETTSVLSKERFEIVLGIVADIILTCISMVGIDYSGVSNFNTGVTRLGVALRGFSERTQNIDKQKIQDALSIIDDIKTAGETINSIPNVQDLAPTITNIGAAIKLYNSMVSENIQDSGESTSDGEANTKGIAQMFKDLAEDMPDTTSIEEVSKFANNGGGLTEFALGITALAEALSGFSTSMQTVDSGAIDLGCTTLGKLALIQAALPAKDDDYSFLTRLTGKRQSLAEFALDIEALGDALNRYGNSLAGEGVSENIEKANAATSVLVELNKALPSTGGLVGIIMGNKNFTTLGNSLSPLGTGLAAYADAVKGHDFSEVSESVKPLSALATVQNSLSPSNGLVTRIVGIKSLADFGNQMRDLGKGFADYATSINGTKFDTDKINTSIAVVKSLSEVQASLEPQNGLVQAIVGNKDLTTFTTSIENLGKGIANYATAVAGKDFAKVNESISPIQALSKVKNELKDDGIISLITGRDNFGTFVENVKKVGEAMADYSDKVSGKNFSNVEDSLKPISVLSDIQNSLKKAGGVFDDVASVTSVSDNLASIGNSINQFMVNISANGMTYNKEALDAPLSIVERMANATFSKNLWGVDVTAGHLPSVGDKIREFSEKVKNVDADKFDIIGRAIMNFAGSTISDSDKGKKKVEELKAYLDEISKELANTLSTSFTNEVEENGHKDKIIQMLVEIMNSSIDILNAYSKDFEILGNNLVVGLANGVKDNAFKLSDAMDALSKQAEKRFREYWGIHSPSTLGEYLSGLIPEGGILGLKDVGGDLLNFAGDLFGADLGDVVGNGLESVGDLVGEKLGGWGGLLGDPLGGFLEGTSGDDMLDFFSFLNAGGDGSELTLNADDVLLDLDKDSLGGSGGGGGGGSLGGSGGGGGGGGGSGGSGVLGKKTATVSSGGLNLSMTDGYTVGDIVNRIDRLENAITNMKIVLDSGILVGSMASGMNSEFANYLELDGRWN